MTTAQTKPQTTTQMTATPTSHDERPAALAIVAHPDDIEFSAAGTLLLLRDAGWAIHYLNVADGDCGSMTMSREETSRTRAHEARTAAGILGAEFHESLATDLLIFYEERRVGRLSGRFEHAEGWRRHLHIGFSARQQDPLADALGEHCHVART